MASKKRKAARKRVQSRASRWTALSDPNEKWSAHANGAKAFVRAAVELIAPGKEEAERTEAEEHGVRIVQRLAVIFGTGAPEEWAPRLRRALDELGSDAIKVGSFVLGGGTILGWSPEPSVDLFAQRHRAVKAIAQSALRWKEPLDNDAQQQLLSGLVNELVVIDAAFETLRDAHADLAAKLDAFDPAPKGKRGAKGPETILAELIVEGCDALGIDAGSDPDDEDAVERVRCLLADSVSRFRSG